MSEFIKAVDAAGFETLSFKDEYFNAYLKFDFAANHRDPFDRYLIAVASAEKLAMFTKDGKFQFYNNELDIIW